ncbi:KpsF/GutQ family sugar-phosphate isomerase [Thorsellia kenyensis]|uniref:Arabinose 5-phosphate isomerase n=1 Tax=Thorsellia kenyensis TaxID=1549888 RepID=A0ABV6C6T2_9GAMM
MRNENDFKASALRTLKIEIEAIEGLFQYIDEHFQQACELIYQTEGKVVLMGMGKSGHIAKKLAATFASTGTPAFFVHPAEASHGDLGMISKQDILILISNSGESPEIIALLHTLKRLKTPIIAMTNSKESTLAKIADVHVCIKVDKEACPLGLAPSASTTATLVMGDAMAISLLEARGFDANDFALSHPGGALGKRLLLRVKDIMHSGDEMPLIQKEASLKESLLVMTEKKLGIVVIVDHTNSRVLGVFTDGDLRRIFNSSINISEATIDEVMSNGCISIQKNALAVDALNLMQDKKITSVVVKDKEVLAGVLHMHDLLKAGVV